MRILLFLLFPVFLSAQINRAYGVIEIGSTFPSSSSTGPKFAYRPADSSFYRWQHTNVWIKIVEPSITPDTLYLQQISGTTAVVNGDTINLTPYVLKTDTTSILAPYIKLAGWGLTKLTSTLQVDTSKVATRYYTSTLPTSILSGQVAYSNGSNLVGSPNFIWDNPNRRIGLGTTPTVDIDVLTSTNTPVGIQLINSNGGNNSYSYMLFRASATGGRLAIIGKMGDGVPSAQTRNAGDFYLYNGANFGDIVLHNDYPSGKIRFTSGAGATTQMTLHSTGNLLLGTTTDVATSILTARSTTKSSSPFPLHTLAESDAITGVQGNFDYETTQNGLRWYNGTRKAYALESTFARGTATRVPYFDVNGQISETINLRYNYANGYFYMPQFISPRIETYTDDIIFVAGTNGRVRFNAPSGLDNLMWFYTGGVYRGQFSAGNTLFALNHTSQIYIAQQGGILPYINIGGNGVSVGNGSVAFPSYPLHIQGASTIGLGRGGVSSRPTIVSSTTPFWYNTDSTALEYGVSVGVWAQVATRAYVRGLAVTDTWLGSRLATGNVSISEQTRNLRLGLAGFYVDSIYINSQTVPENTIIANKAFFPSSGITGLTGNSNTVFNGLINGTHGGFGNYAVHGATITANGSGANFNNAQGISTVVYGTENQAIGYNIITGSSSTGRNTMYGRNLNANNYSGTLLLGDSLTATANGQVKIGNSLNNSQLFFGQKFTYDYDTYVLRLSDYGTGTKEAADLSKTQSAYIAGFATDGTVLDLERKRDTTIFLTADTDYDFSAAVTTTQIASRYNRIIIHMTLTSGVGADKTTTLHTPDANLMQCEILIRGTDNTGSFDNEIAFGTNNAISSDGTNASGYTLAQGQGLHVRVVYNGSAYKYIYY